MSGSLGGQEGGRKVAVRKQEGCRKVAGSWKEDNGRLQKGGRMVSGVGNVTSPRFQDALTWLL